MNRSLYDGDHWLGGAGWIGPIPAMSDETYEDLKAEIHRHFCSRNVVKEIVDRAVDGLLGREPLRLFSGESSDGVRLEEAQRLALGFWGRRQNLKVLKEVMGRQKLGERVCVRFYVPRGLLLDTPAGPAFPDGSIEECLDRIYVHVTLPGQAAVVLDRDTQREIAVYTEADGEGHEYLEAVYRDQADPDVTVMRVFDGGSDDEGARYEWRLGGRLTIYEPRVRSIVSRQVRENQFAINLAKTMQSHNVVTGGFLERIITDAMPPGRWIDDPERPGQQIYEVGPFKVGAGTTNFYMAAEYRDSQGNISHGKPSVYFREPVSNETFITAKRDCYQDILEEVSQAHYLMSGDATSSGVSRVQARAAFEAHLSDDKGELDALAVWMLETPLAMASFFAGQAGYFDGITAEAACYVDTGPLTAEERAAVIELWEKGLIPTETAMSQIGIDDVAGNIEALVRETSAEAGDVSALPVREKRAEIVRLLTGAGAGIEAASRVAGFEKQQASAMARSDFIEQEEQEDEQQEDEQQEEAAAAGKKKEEAAGDGDGG